MLGRSLDRVTLAKWEMFLEADIVAVVDMPKSVEINRAVIATIIWVVERENTWLKNLSVIKIGRK